MFLFVMIKTVSDTYPHHQALLALGAAGAHRLPPGEELEEDDAESIHVHLVADLAVHEVLRGQVPERAGHVVPGDLRRRVGRPQREAEVTELWFAIFRDEYVGGLDVPVDHHRTLVAASAATTMEIIEGARYSDSHLESLRPA
jgi:hypothetical protein